MFELMFTFFLQMIEKGANLLKKVEISVTEAEKRTGKNAVSMQETYTVYLIETRYITSCTRLSCLHILTIFPSDHFTLKTRSITFISLEHHQHVLAMIEICIYSITALSGVEIMKH